MDSEGCRSAMLDGWRVARFSPQVSSAGRVPGCRVRCPTMVLLWRRRYENAVYYNYQRKYVRSEVA